MLLFLLVGKSVTSGESPMSRGSFVSSESAGSSNSLDEPDMDPAARILTPNDEHNPPATIFEESSAESCIEQTTTSGGDHFRGSGRNSTNISVIPQLESRYVNKQLTEIKIEVIVIVHQFDEYNYNFFQAGGFYDPPNRGFRHQLHTD